MSLKHTRIFLRRFLLLCVLAIAVVAVQSIDVKKQ